MCKTALASRLCFDRSDLKQSIRGGTKLSRRNINLEDVSTVLRTQPSNRRETDGGMDVVDSVTDWKPMESMQKRGNMVIFW